MKFVAQQKQQQMIISCSFWHISSFVLCIFHLMCLMHSDNKCYIKAIAPISTRSLGISMCVCVWVCVVSALMYIFTMRTVESVIRVQNIKVWYPLEWDQDRHLHIQRILFGAYHWVFSLFFLWINVELFMYMCDIYYITQVLNFFFLSWMNETIET